MLQAPPSLLIAEVLNPSSPTNFNTETNKTPKDINTIFLTNAIAFKNYTLQLTRKKKIMKFVKHYAITY